MGMTKLLHEVAEEKVAELGDRLVDRGITLPERYRVLFLLRNAAGEAATRRLIEALECRDLGNLFRHDVAFCLGQRQDGTAIAALRAVVEDAADHPMVRHEAGEALGAIATPECLEVVERFTADPCPEMAETCQLALARIAYRRRVEAGEAEELPDENPYLSVDPTPALPASTPMAELRARLLDEGAPMFERYRALFAVRNKGGAEAVQVLGEAFGAKSALLKHEVAYVFGQLAHPASAAVLERVLRDEGEHAMVRHEAAEALGAVATDKGAGVLRDLADDPEPIVAHSCIVALDELETHLAGGEYLAVA